MTESQAKPRITLRKVEEADLPIFFEHQRDPIASARAAFPSRERDAFLEHWRKILRDEQVIARTIQEGSRTAGNIVCWHDSGKELVGYWLGRAFWGRGLASAALAEFVAQVPHRPLHAYVARHNGASIRILEKCGFRPSPQGHGAVEAGGEEEAEHLYLLD